MPNSCRCDLGHRPPLSRVLLCKSAGGEHDRQSCTRSLTGSRSTLRRRHEGSGRRSAWGMAGCGITSAHTGEAITAMMSTDFGNTGSFRYRPDQVANPYDLSFNTRSQAQGYRCSNPGHQMPDCWLNQAAFVTPSFPAAGGAVGARLRQLENRKSARGRRPSWISISCCSDSISNSALSSAISSFTQISDYGEGDQDGFRVDFSAAAEITSTARDNRQMECALKYTPWPEHRDSVGSHGYSHHPRFGTPVRTWSP